MEIEEISYIYYCMDKMPALLQKVKQKFMDQLTKKKKKTKTLDGRSLRQQILKLPSLNPQLSSSTFFTTHLPMLLAAPQIQPLLQKKLCTLYSTFTKSQAHSQQKSLQIHLASIMLSISEPDGLHHIFIKFWIQYCLFEMAKILGPQGKGMGEVEGESNQMEKQMGKPIKKEDLGVRLEKFLHAQFFYICLFCYRVAMIVYEGDMMDHDRFSEKELFLLIKKTITSVQGWQKIHRTFIKHNKPPKTTTFSKQQIQQNMQQLQKICQLSKIPAPFLDSINLLDNFIRQPQIQQKLKTAVHLLTTLKQQMHQYRKINNIKKQYIFCTDDVLTALTFVMWRLGKNLYGPSNYVRIVLCCDFHQIRDDVLGEKLDLFGDSVRFGFQTVFTVAGIGLLEQHIVDQIL